jgi:hypothetical protein
VYNCYQRLLTTASGAVVFVYSYKQGLGVIHGTLHQQGVGTTQNSSVPLVPALMAVIPSDDEVEIDGTAIVKCSEDVEVNSIELSSDVRV